MMPPAPPYPGGGFPPGGYPPGGFPPVGYSPHPPQGNGFAVASLICSILGFCVVFLGGLLGILFGILGLRKASQPNTGGRGMAIAGILVGIITLLTSAGIISLGYFGFSTYRNFAGMGQQYIRDLSAGNIDAALAQTQGMTRAEVQAQSEQLQSMGAYVSWTPTSFQQSTHTNIGVGKTGEMTISGTAHFANGAKPFKLTIMLKPDRTWKVTSASFE
jgi:hypothetical protein